MAIAIDARRWRLVVFDWDGTLMDSTAQIIEAAARAISQLGLPQRPANEIREIIGLGLRDCWQRLFPEVAAEHFMPFIEAYRNHYLSAELGGPQPFQSTERTLARLSDDGFQLAVATGKSRAGLERDLGRTGLGRYFHATRTADDCRAKPCPDMLTEILATLRAEASAAVMVGDTEWDLEMARRAGVRAWRLPGARIRASGCCRCPRQSASTGSTICRTGYRTGSPSRPSAPDSQMSGRPTRPVGSWLSMRSKSAMPNDSERKLPAQS